MKNFTYLLVFTIVSLIGCSGTIKSDNNTNPNKKISILRLDKDIYNYLQQPGKDKEASLREKYPILLPAFGRIAMDNSDPETFFTTLKEYFAHPTLMQIYKDAISTFGDVSLYEEQLSDASTLAGKYLPNKKLPEFAMHVSGFRENVIVLNNLISISTDKYLGTGYNAYKGFFQQYELQQMKPEYIVRDYMKAWLMSDIIKPNTDNQDLLSAMVAEGKILYTLSVLLPNQDKNDIIGYTPSQQNWAEQNEKDIWKKVIKQNYLFSTDHMLITRFINDAAYTSPISTDSPGRIGSWIGWQIVKQYAKKKGASLQDIIDADAQTILKDSKYNP